MFAIRVVALAAYVLGQAQSEDMENRLMQYMKKVCKYNIVPNTLVSRAYRTDTGEIHVNDVFGVPAFVKRHVIHLPVQTASFVTLQAGVHRDTPATLSLDVVRRDGSAGVSGRAGRPARVLEGRHFLGTGGEETMVFVHGEISDKESELDIVLELSTVEVAKSQVDAHIQEAHCWPVRLDITVIPVSRANLHWPVACPDRNFLPAPLGRSTDGGILVLEENGLSLAPLADNKHYVYRFNDDRPYQGFGQSLWDSIIEVPPRLHRFVRFFFRSSFRFASGPLQLVLELFDLKDTPDGTALAPACAMGCLGGVPVYNGQLIDHAMPTGFRYRIWVLRANMGEWANAINGKRCVEFDMDVSIKFEQRLTPFEVGPAAWLCASTRLPSKIVQTSDFGAWNEHVNGKLMVGRSVWIRDRFGFPPNEVADMEHLVEIEISEPCIFRATTHHSDGVDIYIALTKQGATQRECKAVRHPGPVPRQTIFCYLQPGKYILTFFADYPLGGLHPCGDFFAQVAIRPMTLNDPEQTKQCLGSVSDLTQLQVPKALKVATGPLWKSIKVPIKFGETSNTVVVYRNLVEVSPEEAATKPYLRLVVQSDYVSSDLRFQVRYGGKFIADTQVTAHGYADMIGPLDPGAYDVEMYYIIGTGAPEGTKLCSSSMVDIRLVSQISYRNSSSPWMCSSTRVPPPDRLTPHADEQVLIDSEYFIPESSTHTIMLKFTDRRLLRVVAISKNHRFTVELKNQDRSLVVQGTDNIQVSVKEGSYFLELKARSLARGGSSACSTFTLNMLLQPESGVAQCPWSSKVSQANLATLDRAQADANDHIGNLQLDLSPKQISKEVQASAPVALWMNEGLEKEFELDVAQTSAIRVEVGLQPPILPLEIMLRRKRLNGKLEAPISVGEWSESRMLLMESELPKGKYVLKFSQSETYHVMEGRTQEDMFDLCAHVTIFAEVGISSLEAINTLRSELLDLPDLLAVQPFPPSINMVGWYGSTHSTAVGTQVYRFPDGTGKSALKLDSKAIVRIVSEPADLSNAQIDARLTQNGALVASSDSLGQLVVVAGEGTYELELHPHVATSPFLVTLAIASELRLQLDAELQDGQSSCTAAFPKLLPPQGFKSNGWTIGPTVVRLKPDFLGKQGQIASFHVTIASPSVLYIEAGSTLPIDLMRVAVVVPEGLWVGEQRGLRSSLEIELPNGIYEITLSQPKPAPDTISVKRCLDFSVFVMATPLNPDAKTEADMESAVAAAESGAVSQEGSKPQEMTPEEEQSAEAAPCFSIGTVPLPLDLNDPKGGSPAIGGPMDADGRLLVRARVMITDMHDGRKKTYISTGGKKLQLKVGITESGYGIFSLATTLNFNVQNEETHQEVDRVEMWQTKDGWESVYILDGKGFWLIFHHPHRERAMTACTHFGLQIETHPVNDVPAMIRCDGSEVDAEDQLPRTLDISSSQQNKEIFTYSRPMLHVKQPQKGFLTSTRFTLTRTSWVSVHIGYNFFISHAEMDITDTKRRTDTSVVDSTFDFIHGSGHVLNGRLVMSDTLPEGEFVFRVADDHYPNQLGSSMGCFPYSLDVIIVPEGAHPTVVSVMPHPSVPVVRGTDFVVTLRFSEPPAGTLEAVINEISLGGIKAHVGGSVNSLSSRYTTKSTNVLAEVEEGHHVWVITFLADALSELTDASLELGNIVSNTTRKRYTFNAPKYVIVDATAKKTPPWSGGTPQVQPPRPDTSSNGNLGSVGVALSEQSSSGGIGVMKAEGGSIQATLPPSPSPYSSTGSVVRTPSTDSIGSVNFGGANAPHFLPAEAEDHGVMPNVEEWSPVKVPVPSRRPTQPPACPEGTVMNKDSGVCEVPPPGWPMGYRVVVVCSGAGLFFLLYTYWASPRAKDKSRNARFRDIGHRTSEEEMGLVQAADLEDDML